MISELGFEILDVVFSTPPQQPNLILNLNDDCLLNVLEYVSTIGDCVALAKVHSRFDQLVITYKFTELVINYHDNIVVGQNKDMFVRAAPFIQQFSLGGGYNRKYSDFSWMYPHLTALKSLKLKGIKIRNSGPTLPLGLEHLSMEFCRMEIDDKDTNFQLLDPTLRSLKLVGHDGHINFHNIREFEFEFMDDIQEQFVQQNRHSMEHLILHAKHVPTDWRLIEKFENLRHLTIDGNCYAFAAIHTSYIQILLETLGPNLHHVEHATESLCT